MTFGTKIDFDLYNDKEGFIKLAKFVAQLVREGITFDVSIRHENSEATVTLTGGF